MGTRKSQKIFTMSTLSDARRLLKGSERESRVNLRAICLVAVAGVVLYVGWHLLNHPGGELPFGIVSQRPMPEATVPGSPTQAVFAMPTEAATSTAVPTPIVIMKEVQSVVTVEVRGDPVYVEVPGPQVEVTRIVEVTPFVLPTVTPVPLAPGTIQICASVAGAKQLFIGREGVVSGECKVYSFGVGQTEIVVQVNR